MATLSHAGSRRMYSWWWDSHVSPKNSKWLQENLTDMDAKVKAMIKLIEEDADSFRKRAEMYYRKRPELMKLVEEFYRAYRALAERYDHATNALRHAQRTMAEAFPDQIPLMLPDAEPNAPELFEYSDFSEENDVITSKEGSTHEKLANGRAKKELNIQSVVVKSFGDDVEVEKLKGTISKLESEKEAISLQYQLSQEKISKLEADISRRQEDFKKLNMELLTGVTNLRVVDDQCNQLKKKKQSLEVEVDMFKETAKKQQQELDMKQKGLEKLNILLKKERERSIQAEKLHSRSQEEANVLSLKLQKMEMGKVSLEEEIQRLKEKIGSLNEQISFSTLKMQTLQHEISLLEESKRKLEDEVGLHSNDKKSLQQEVWSITAIKKDLEQRHLELTEKIGAVNLNVESLQTLAKELRDGNEELKEICKKHDNERTLHLENLKFLEKITEQNAVLENSLTNSNVELKELREKVKALEGSCETLTGMISMHISDKGVLVSQIDAMARNMEKLSEKNTLLENSLSDVNVELEDLRGKLNSLEDSFQSLGDQNSVLLGEKSSLLTQVESIRSSLENLEQRCAELEGKNLNLEREKDQLLHQVSELQHSLRIKKEEYETLMHSSRRQLAILENQISILQQKGRLDEEELEVEQHKVINAQMEIFVLQRILHDMNGINVLLSDKCEKYLETSKRQEKIISELKTSVLDHEDENHRLILEKSVILTLLERESKTRFEELFVLQSEKHQLLGNLQTCNKKEELLKSDMEILRTKLSDLQEAHSILQSDIAKLVEENQSFSKKIDDLRERNYTMEENNLALILETMKLENLYLVFRSYNDEKAQELQLQSDLNLKEIRSLKEKLGALEVENMNLKESLIDLEECRSRLVILEDEVKTARNAIQELNLEVEIGKNHSSQKEVDLMQANVNFQALQDKNIELSGKIQGLVIDIGEAKALREEFEKKNLTLLEYNTRKDIEFADLHQAKDTLNRRLDRMFEEGKEFRAREKHLNLEIKSCEAETETLLTDIHAATINATIFEEKMLELLITCEGLEISAMIQKDMFYEELTRRDAYEDMMKEKLDEVYGENRSLKEEASSYFPLIVSLGDFVTSLECHVLSLANHHSLRNQEDQDIPQPLEQKSGDEEGNENQNATLAFGIHELEKLHAKVNALENVVIDIQSHLERQKCVSKTTSQALEGESEGLKKKGDVEEKPEQMMKDIQLDHVVSSSQYENGTSSHESSVIISNETKELWEASECDLEIHQIEKELSIDKLELTNKVIESHREMSEKIIEKLSSDSRRLTLLQKSAKELKRTMEVSELSNSPTSFEFKKVKAELKEAESAISHLIDVNSKLTKKAEKLSAYSDTLDERKISEKSRRGSDKLGRMELEMQKLEYIWLKLNEEHDYKKAIATERRTRVMLRDYLYGKRERSPSWRKVHFCACVRPRTMDD